MYQNRRERSLDSDIFSYLHVYVMNVMIFTLQLS